MPMLRVALRPKTSAETRTPSGLSFSEAYFAKLVITSVFDCFVLAGKTAAERSPSVGKRT
jgi:hypothetical protein